MYKTKYILLSPFKRIEDDKPMTLTTVHVHFGYTPEDVTVSSQESMFAMYVSIENDWNFEFLQFTRSTTCDPLGLPELIPIASFSICIREKLRVFHLGPDLRVQLSPILSQNP